MSNPDTELPTCYRHPDQRTGIICQRCDRPICPRCMHQASVGFHCPECAKQGSQKVYSGSVAFGLVRPILTYALIAINVAVFLVDVVISKGQAFTGQIDRLQIDGDLFAKGIAHAGGPVIGVGAGQWWRLITSGFLHYGILHIAFNMWALYVFGTVLERGVGRARMGAIYGVALLAGSLGGLIATPGSPSAGASGAIFGLMGALFVVQRSNGIPFRHSPLLPILLINLFITFTIPNISVGAHIGGLVGGAAAGWLLFDAARRPDVPKFAPWVGCAVLAVGCFVAAIVVANGYNG